jgi:hypothetical protein
MGGRASVGIRHLPAESEPEVTANYRGISGDHRHPVTERTAAPTVSEQRELDNPGLRTANTGRPAIGTPHIHFATFYGAQQLTAEAIDNPAR